MTTASRQGVLFASVFLTAVLAWSCSAATSQEAGITGTTGQAFVRVEPSSFFVTIENLAGQPLLDIRVAIKPVGGATEFTKLVSRVEAGEKRDISLSDFGGRDGTPFSLRVVRPKSITVTAASLTGQKFETTVPWK